DGDATTRHFRTHVSVTFPGTHFAPVVRQSRHAKSFHRLCRIVQIYNAQAPARAHQRPFAAHTIHVSFTSGKGERRVGQVTDLLKVELGIQVLGNTNN